jgi:hypothetical protein
MKIRPLLTYLSRRTFAARLSEGGFTVTPPPSEKEEGQEKGLVDRLHKKSVNFLHNSIAAN